MPLLSVDEIEAHIDAVTLEDVAALATELYAPERLSAAGIGADEDAFRDAIAPALAGRGMIRVGVTGAAGRMGQTVCEAVDGADDMELVARIDPELGVALSDVLGDCDVDRRLHPPRHGAGKRAGVQPTPACTSSSAPAAGTSTHYAPAPAT